MMMSTTGLLFDVHNMVDVHGMIVVIPDEQKTTLLIQPLVPFLRSLHKSNSPVCNYTYTGKPYARNKR